MSDDDLTGDPQQLRRRADIHWEPWRDRVREMRAALPDELPDEALSRIPGIDGLREALQDELERLREYLAEGARAFDLLAQSLDDTAADQARVDDVAQQQIADLRREMEGL